MVGRINFALERLDSPRHSSHVAQLFSLGDIERFDFMKTPRIIWPVLLLVTGLIFWLSVPSAPQARIRVEGDVTDIASTTAASQCSSYDPYFIPENRCDRIFISSRSK